MEPTWLDAGAVSNEASKPWPDVRARNNVHVRGHGPKVMIFAHGFGCDQNMWRLVAPAFETEYRIVLFDYVGAGKSDRAAYSSERYGSLVGYASDVLEICAALDIDDVVFVGHSVSCMIGVLAANADPRLIGRLIMIGPSPCFLNDSDGYVGGFERGDIQGLLDMMDHNYMGWASHLAPIVMQNPDSPEHTRELEESFCSTDPTTAREFAEVTFLSDNRADILELRAPALIIQCSDDALAPVGVGHFLEDHIPHATLEVLEASGHCPHISHPEETIALMRRYLRSMRAE